ncbi:MAG TPA: ribbon-helix-helix domain-containing protein [Stellaceae bacterium]|nr:ribbon-helix-helix domain-containing protein [Stellaceae bacterium]
MKAAPASTRSPSRVGKRVLSIYLDPIAWRQLRELALDLETSTQVLGEEAINLLFEKHRRNRSA